MLISTIRTCFEIPTESMIWLPDQALKSVLLKVCLFLLGLTLPLSPQPSQAQLSIDVQKKQVCVSRLS